MAAAAALLLPLMLCNSSFAAGPPPAGAGIPVGGLELTLSAEQTVTQLKLSGAAGADGFSFTGAGGGKSHLGDVSIRVRPAPAAGQAAEPWASFLSSGATPIPNGTACAKQLPCKATLMLEGATDTDTEAPAPFTILREWEQGPNATLRLVFKVTNTGAADLEIGGMGMAMPFAWNAGSPAGDLASTFTDPAITGEHGFATVTRLSGTHEILMITTGVDAAWCAKATPGAYCRTSMEAWGQAMPMPKAAGSASEIGSGAPGGAALEWFCHTKAYADDWANASKAWLPATSLVLKKGEAKDYVLLFSLASDIRSKDAALAAASTAVVHGVPGYILGMDMTTAKLLIRPPPGVTLVSAHTDTPAALTVGAPVAARSGPAGWISVPVRATADGRPRVTLTFSDKSFQVINYRTLPAFDEHIDKYGEYQADTVFFTDEDPFGRSPSFMPWDRELNKTVLNDARTFVVGLSDDAGGGANEGFAGKMRYRPTQHELEKLDLYVNSTLWGKELDGAGVPVSLQDHSSFGIRSSMYWVPLPTTNETGEPG